MIMERNMRFLRWTQYMAIGIVSLAAFNVQASVDAQSVVREAANRVINVLETEGDIVRNDPDKIYQIKAGC